MKNSVDVEAGKRRAAKLKAKDPDYFVKLGRKSQQAYKKKPASERKPRGFAAMDPDRLREVSSKGGKNRGKKDDR